MMFLCIVGFVHFISSLAVGLDWSCVRHVMLNFSVGRMVRVNCLLSRMSVYFVWYVSPFITQKPTPLSKGTALFLDLVRFVFVFFILALFFVSIPISFYNTNGQQLFSSGFSPSASNDFYFYKSASMSVKNCISLKTSQTGCLVPWNKYSKISSGVFR